jgi:hypothetical protein
LPRFPLALILCLASTTILFACDYTPATPTTAPIATKYKPSISITRVDYDAALKLWESQGISEYEITAREVSERSGNGYPETYRVKGDEVTVLQSMLRPGELYPTPLILTQAQLILGNTIEGLFERADRAIADQREDRNSQTVYDIRFDPTYGYVTYFEVNCYERVTPTGRRTVLNCPSDSYMQVKSSDFKVLSRDAPAATAVPIP